MKIVFILAAAICSVFSGELTLQKAQDLLIKNNYDLYAAEEEIKKALAEVNEAQSAFYPSLDAYFTYSYVSEKAKIKMISVPFPVTIGQNDRTELGLDLSYPLFSGMSRIYNLKNKEIGLSAKKQNLQAIKNQYLFMLGITYFRWNFYSKQLDVRKKSIVSMTSYTDQMQILHGGGVVVKTKVLEAQAKLKSAELDYIVGKNQIDSIKIELLGLLNVNDSGFTPQTENFLIDTMHVPENLMATRPEIQLYEKNAQQLQYLSKVTYAQRYPMVTGTAGFRYGDPGLNQGTDAFMNYFQFGAIVKWNIFDGLKNKAQRAQIQKQITIVKIDKEKNIDSWNRSLVSWKMQINSADDRIAVSKASMAAADDLMKSLENSLKSGVVTDVDYENAVTNFAEAWLLFEQAKLSKRVAVLNALYTSGINITY